MQIFDISLYTPDLYVALLIIKRRFEINIKVRKCDCNYYEVIKILKKTHHQNENMAISLYLDIYFAYCISEKLT